MKTLVSSILLVGLVSYHVSADAITRTEAIVRARTYAQHPWHCNTENLTASCSTEYESVYSVGDYVGLPYDWGGYVTLDQFDKGIDDGDGAGSYAEHGVLGCTVGLDCSGFVSRVWKAGHKSTSSMHTISHEIDASDVLPADAFNIPGYHVKLFETTQANGDPRFIEAAGYNTHVTFWESWTSVDGYTPIRYDSITDQQPAYTDGTADSPVTVDGFPFVDERDTTLSMSDMFDVCLGAAPSTGEYGPEVIYLAELTQPGTITAAVQDDAGTDVDVHLYRALNELECFARNDKVVESEVDCGPLYVVVDSYTSASSGKDFPGPYTLSIDFEPDGGPCGQDPPPFDPGGKAGEPCGFPGDPLLPFCNPNLGGVVCLYSSGVGAQSFCSYPCKADEDCQADFPGGCCVYIDADLGDACLTEPFCTTFVPDVGNVPDEAAPDTGTQQDDLQAPDIPPQPESIPEDPPDATIDAAHSEQPGQESWGPDTAYPPDTASAGSEPGLEGSSGCSASSVKHVTDSTWRGWLACCVMVALFLFTRRTTGPTDTENGQRSFCSEVPRPSRTGKPASGVGRQASGDRCAGATNGRR